MDSSGRAKNMCTTSYQLAEDLRGLDDISEKLGVSIRFLFFKRNHTNLKKKLKFLGYPSGYLTPNTTCGIRPTGHTIIETAGISL